MPLLGFAILGCIVETHHAACADADAMRAVKDPRSGQIDLLEGAQAVLRYNYATVQLPAGYLQNVAEGNRRYAVARSNYIHPLYGLDGELLTTDWSHDHPHHRGIYWAWPEVDYGEVRGDLHALQLVFARPTGACRLSTADDWAQVEAENRWMWGDTTPIVHEVVVIRAYRANEMGRHIDLKFTFLALEDGVSIARRGTNAYGGLNIRFSPVEQLQIITHEDPVSAKPRRAWADAIGSRRGGNGTCGVAILPRKTNPGYPGQWVQYPQLPWVQPTFPPAGTRHKLEKGQPLVLEYRLWIHRDRVSNEHYIQQWQVFNE